MMKKRMQGMDKGARGAMGSHMMGYPHAVLAHAEELKLSDEQMGKIARIRLRHHAEHQKIMHRMRKSMHEVHKRLMDPAADGEAIRKASKEHSQAHEAMIEERINARAEAQAVLTSRATRSA